MDILVLRLDAPLISFGGPIVDNRGVVQEYPALSLVTGLLGNALGYDHADADRLEALQRRIRYACRQDRQGHPFRDYQTVDFSRPYMNDENAWTTAGRLETRKGGSASEGTHIRYRDYRADAVYTVALALDPPDDPPDTAALEQALRRPARPLFLGRKACLPSTALFLERRTADSLRDALLRVPLSDRADASGAYPAWWPVLPNEPAPEGPAVRETMRRPVTDRRDWINQIHVGERWMARGEVLIKPGAAPPIGGLPPIPNRHG